MQGITCSCPGLIHKQQAGRAGSSGAPRQFQENSLDAYRAALQAGADGVELDVRMSSDGLLPLRHDDGLPSGATVAGSTLEALREADALIPTLAEALLAPGLTVVEMKSQGPERNHAFAAAVAATLGSLAQRLVISSFDWPLLRTMRSLVGVPTAMLVGSMGMAGGVDGIRTEAADAGHAELHVERRILSSGPGDEILGLGIPVVAWTVNDPDEALSLHARGVSAVITDVPDVMVSARPAEELGAADDRLREVVDAVVHAQEVDRRPAADLHGDHRLPPARVVDEEPPDVDPRVDAAPGFRLVGPPEALLPQPTEKSTARLSRQCATSTSANPRRADPQSTIPVRHSRDQSALKCW